MIRKNGIKSYVPERDALRGKNATPARLCLEDCAVLLPREGAPQLLAYRSAEEIEGKLSAFSENEWRFLRERICDAPHLLLCGEECSALVFGEAFVPTGTVLAILLPHRAGTVARALLGMGRSDFLFSPAVSPSRPSPIRDEKAAAHVGELLSITDRALGTGRGVGMRTRCLLLASLAGCKLTADELPVLPDGMSKREIQQIGLLLLCLLLTMRQRDGELMAGENGEDGYHVTWTESPISSHDNANGRDMPAFLTFPCFSGYRASYTDRGFCIEIPLESRGRHRRAPLLQSESMERGRTITLQVLRKEIAIKSPDKISQRDPQ